MGFSGQQYWSGVPLPFLLLPILVIPCVMYTHIRPFIKGRSIRNNHFELKIIVIKNVPFDFDDARDARDLGSIFRLGRSPGVEWQSTRYSCLENSMDRGAWWATVHGAAKSWIQLSDSSTTFLSLEK